MTAELIDWNRPLTRITTLRDIEREAARLFGSPLEVALQPVHDDPNCHGVLILSTTVAGKRHHAEILLHSSDMFLTFEDFSARKIALAVAGLRKAMLGRQ